jgi:4-hydroxybenzoate polyprenyltransferase
LSTLKFWLKVTRPIQVVLGGFAAWAVALLSDGPTWFSSPKIMVALVAAFSILGVSIWHYGARSDIYALKHWDLVIVKKPHELMLKGALSFFASIILAWIFLPYRCLMIAIMNMIIMLLYARFLDRYWPWKNIFIAGICVTPLLLGWFSGHRLSPIVPPMILATFFFYLSREIFKDITDIEANRGKRFTMVMHIGTPASLRIGGVALMFSIITIIYALKYVPESLQIWSPSILGAIWLAWFAFKALKAEDIAPKFRWLDVGALSILVFLVRIRASMY